MARRRRPRPPERSQPATSEPSPPSLAKLDQFSRASLGQWKRAGRNLERLSQALYFEIERHRAENAEGLVDAIRSRLKGPFQFEDWARIVDYRYTLEPLSVAGSVQHDGGRFNIGGALNPAVSPAFPALYLAEDLDTAFLERFGIERTAQLGGLSGEEIALRKPGSFTHVAVRGKIELLFDVGDVDALRPFASIIAGFKMPALVRTLSRQLRMTSPPSLVRSAGMLQAQLLHPNWRLQPAQYDLPSNSQIFGRICAAAGAHGIRFPSARLSSRHCLALFPQNWTGSDSYVEVTGALPPAATCVRLDGDRNTVGR